MRIRQDTLNLGNIEVIENNDKFGLFGKHAIGEVYAIEKKSYDINSIKLYFGLNYLIKNHKYYKTKNKYKFIKN